MKDQNYKELLEVAEMTRDYLQSQGKINSLAYKVTDQAIRNYYKLNPCPHKNKFLNVVNTVCGCETTVLYCPDCEKELTKPETDC